MNKEKFLKELEKRLIILNDNEKNDIINEYRDTIEQKVKHGQTEKDAVKDFGDIDELAKEILSAYKINPDYSKKSSDFSEKTKDIVNDCEQAIKKGAKKMAEITDDIVEGMKSSNPEITLELVFEILIKALLLLILIAILRIPFEIIAEIGYNIVKHAYFPFDLLGIVWSFIVWIVYVLACVCLGISFFKQYYKKPSNPSTKKQNKEIEETETKSKKKEITNKPVSILSTIIKVFVTICILIPLFFCVFALILATVILGILTFKGLPLLGVFILLLGISILFMTLFDFVSSITYSRFHNPIYGLIIGSILMITGIAFTVDKFMNFEYQETVPSDYEKTIETYTLNINNKLYINDDDININVKIDNELENNTIILEIQYYEQFIDFNENILTNNKIKLNNYIERNIDKEDIKQLYSTFEKNIKENTIHNYVPLFIPDITITVNNNTKSLIEID